MGGSKPSLKLLHSSLNLNFTLTCSMIINYSSLMKIGIGHSRMLILSYFTDLFIDPFCVQYIAEVYILISSRFHAFPLQITILLLTASARRWPCLESSIFGTVPRFFGKLLAKVFMHLFNDTVAWGYWLTGCQEEFVVVVSPNFLSSTSNTFAASLRASLSYWSLQVICANIN